MYNAPCTRAWVSKSTLNGSGRRGSAPLFPTSRNYASAGKRSLRWMRHTLLYLILPFSPAGVQLHQIFTVCTDYVRIICCWMAATIRPGCWKVHHWSDTEARRNQCRRGSRAPSESCFYNASAHNTIEPLSRP